MIIRELTITNFGVFSGINSFQFSSLGDPQRNITLIGGKNGCGKTTFLDAIMLVLYGRRSPVVKGSQMTYPAYLKKSIHKEADSANVELSFTIPARGKNIDFRIKRSWSNAVKPIDQLDIWQDAHYDEHLAENWDTFVEEVVPSGIAGLFFFDGEKISRLAEEEETSETTQASIKAMLGIDIIDSLMNDMKRITKRNETAMNRLEKSDNLQNIEDELNAVELQISQNKQKFSNLSNSKDRAELKLGEKEKAFFQEGGTLGINRAKINETKANIKAALDVKKSELINISAGSLPLYLVRSYLKKIRDTVEKEEKIKTAQYVFSFFENFNQEFASSLETIKDLSEAQKGHIHTFLSEKRNEINALKSERQVFELSPSSVQLIETILTGKDERLAELTHSLNELSQLDVNLEQTERYLLAEVDENNTNKLLSEIKKIAAQISTIEHEQEEIGKEIARLEGIKANLTTLRSKALQQEYDQRNIRDESTRMMKYAAKTQEIMAEFKRLVLFKKVDKLAQKINECFNYITYKSSFISKIEIDPESLRLTLFNSKDKPVLKSQLSAGERQMLAISILWGLALCSKHALPIIIDTPLGRLDSIHRTYFVAKYLPKASHQVIVLSTDEEIKGSYLEMIEKNIAGKYLLKYDDNKQSTTISKGYFEGKVS